MQNYVEYLLEDGSIVLVEVDEQRGVIHASDGKNKPIQSKLNFKQAFASVRSSMKEVLTEFDDLHVEEGVIKFGLKSIGEAGLFAVGKVGAESNFEVTLIWRKPKNKIPKNKRITRPK